MLNDHPFGPSIELASVEELCGELSSRPLPMVLAVQVLDNNEIKIWGNFTTDTTAGDTLRAFADLCDGMATAEPLDDDGAAGLN